MRSRRLQYAVEQQRPRLRKRVPMPNPKPQLLVADDHELEVHRFALPRYGYFDDGETDAEVEALRVEAE